MNDHRDLQGNDLEHFLRNQFGAFDDRDHWHLHSLGAENHWLFIQAYDALKHELYLPACAGFLTAIEASLRNTMAQVKAPAPVTNVDDIALLSNSLLRQARANGISIDGLAFPGEQDFESNLPTRQNVEIVRVRHNLCHGNILEYVNTREDTPTFFTPERCRNLAYNLHAISRNWVASLGVFRKKVLDLQ